MKLYKAVALGAIVLSFILTGCDIDKTQEGKMPEVDVDVSGGQLPEYKVEGPDVTVGSKTVEVTVPTLTVDLPEEEDNAMGQPATEPLAESPE